MSNTSLVVLMSSASGCSSTGWVFVVYACPTYPEYRYLLKRSCMLWHISVCYPPRLASSGFSSEYVHSPGSCQSWSWVLLMPFNIKLLLDKNIRRAPESGFGVKASPCFDQCWCHWASKPCSSLLVLGILFSWLCFGPGLGGGSLPSLGLQPRLTAQ